MSGSGGKVGRQLSKLSANEDRKTFMSYSMQIIIQNMEMD